MIAKVLLASEEIKEIDIPEDIEDQITDALKEEVGDSLILDWVIEDRELVSLEKVKKLITR